MKKNGLLPVILLCLFGFLPPNVFTQTFTEISGTVKNRGAVIPGANVGVSNISGTLNRVTVTDNGGFYRFTMLPVDRYIIRIVFAGFKDKRLEVTTGIGQASVLDIDLDVGSTDSVILTGSITGKVTDKDDNIIKGAKLSYAKKNSLQDRKEVDIGEDGKFNIPDLVDGKYVLFFESDGFKSKQKEIRVKNKEQKVDIELKRK